MSVLNMLIQWHFWHRRTVVKWWNKTFKFQGSVVIDLRRGGQNLKIFVALLLRMLYAKSHQNRLKCHGIIQKLKRGTFFLKDSVISYRAEVIKYMLHSTNEAIPYPSGVLWYEYLCESSVMGTLHFCSFSTVCWDNLSLSDDTADAVTLDSFFNTKVDHRQHITTNTTTNDNDDDNHRRRLWVGGTAAKLKSSVWADQKKKIIARLLMYT